MNNKRVIKLTEFIAHGGNVTSCSIGRKCNRIAATGGEDKKVNLWTLNKPTCIMSLTGHTSAINSITFSSNEDKIVSGSSSGSLKVWDLEANKLISNLVGHKANVTCLEYHTYADYIASGSIDAQIRLWDLRRKGCIFTYKGHTNSINALKFSPDSKWIASVSDDCLVKIWDLKAGRLLTDLKGHTAAVNSLEFHPNEFLLATGSSDRTVKFWDLEKMELVSTNPFAHNSIKLIMFETNGKCLFSASQDYLQSLSWEPSKCYDSVYCQWRQVSDMAICSNKLIAASANQNMVSFYAVDLLQVMPLGTAPHVQDELESKLNDFSINTYATNNGNQVKASSSSTRRNFHHHQQLEATEQPDENHALQQLQNEITDASEANICDQEEYNKIFRPRTQIKRVVDKSPVVAKPETSAEPLSARKLSGVKSKQSASDKDKDGVDKSFFIDIKVAQPPTPKSPLAPIQSPQPPQSSHISSPSTAAESSSSSKTITSSSSQNKITSPIKTNEPDPNNLVNKITPRSDSKSQIKNFSESPANLVNQVNTENDFKIQQQTDLLSTVEAGHDSFIKALRNRQKNIQIVRNMWVNGNVKSALDAAVSMDDTSLMADILAQINQLPAAWNLDTCTILLPSIKNLIASKYEEHMQIGSDSCKLVFKNFGKLIKSNLNGQIGIGVDLSREERQRKCNSCYTYLLEIVTIIEKKLSTVVSSKLLNNFREINLLMKTIDN